MIRLPPLTALRAFEAAARHLSFTKAAAELSVTQAAVSYQIRQLEEHVGRPMFRRLTRRLELTPEGEEFHAAVTDAFDRIRAAAERLAERRDGVVLSISTLHSFAGHWLVPRLGHFQLRHPDIAVRLECSNSFVNLDRDFDIGIRSGDGRWSGTTAVKLMDYAVTPLLSPALVERAGGLRQLADLLKLPLLDTQHAEDRRLWLDWFAAAGVPVSTLPSGTQFDTQHMSAQAAMMGQGAALICPTFFGPELASGRLVAPFPRHQLRPGTAYWLVTSDRRGEEAKIKAFRDWILSEVTACAGQCGDLGGDLGGEPAGHMGGAPQAA